MREPVVTRGPLPITPWLAGSIRRARYVQTLTLTPQLSQRVCEGGPRAKERSRPSLGRNIYLELTALVRRVLEERSPVAPGEPADLEPARTDLELNIK